MFVAVMDMIERYIQRHKNVIQLFLFNFVILLIFWGGLAHNQYNADTVFYRYQETGAAINVRLEEGRYLLALMNFLLPLFGINVAKRIGITVLCNILLFCLTLIVMYDLLCSEDKVNWFHALCVDLIFINVFASEMFMFAETLFGFGFGYLFSALAVRAFCRKQYVRFVLYLCIGVCFYQYTIIIAAILLLFSVGKEERWQLSGTAFFRSFFGSVTCLVVGFLNMESTKVLACLGILSTEKVRNEQQVSLHILDKLSDILNDMHVVLYDAKGLMIGAGVPLVVSLVTAGLLVIYVIRYRDWNRLVYVCLLTIVCFFLWSVLPLVRATYENPPRMSFSFFMIQGLFLLLTLQLWGNLSEREENKVKQQDKQTTTCLILTQSIIGAYVLVQLLSVQNIVNNRYASQAIDETYVRLMYQRILDYEEESGINVTKLATCNDQSVSDYYREVSTATDSINERVLGKASWSIVCDVSGRLFERIDMDADVYNCYFSGKNWDHLDLDQQLVIREDTAYWCIY